MKAGAISLLLLLGVGLGAAGGYWYGHRASSAPAGEGASAAESQPTTEPAKGEEVKAVATVRVAPIRRGSISRQITAYGSVVVPPGEVRVTSVPFESRVTRILVAANQSVSAGEPLIEVEGSSATILAMEEARNAAEAARRDLDMVQKRYDQKLATNAELFAAQTALRSAQSKLQSLQHGGGGAPKLLKTDVAGIVDKVDVQVGQVVAIGSPLVEVAADNRIEVKLGVDPRDATQLKPGSTVTLHPIDNSAGEIEGKIRVISRRVDPLSRLVDVNLSLPVGTKWMLDGAVSGQIAVASVDGLVVPRQAVLPDEAGEYSLFTVNDGAAAKHPVHITMENDHEVVVTADGLKEGDSVIMEGNFELDDGMKVVVQTPATEPASPEPSTEPAATEPSPASVTQPATQPEERK